MPLNRLQIAHEKSDFVILTNTSPRGEDPSAIINDIVAGEEAAAAGGGGFWGCARCGASDLCSAVGVVLGWRWR